MSVGLLRVIVIKLKLRTMENYYKNKSKRAWREFKFAMAFVVIVSVAMIVYDLVKYLLKIIW